MVARRCLWGCLEGRGRREEEHRTKKKRMRKKKKRREREVCQTLAELVVGVVVGGGVCFWAVL